MKISSASIVSGERLTTIAASPQFVRAIHDSRTQDRSGITFGGGHAPVALNSKANSPVKVVLAQDMRTSDNSALSFGAGYAPHCLTGVR